MSEQSAPLSEATPMSEAEARIDVFARIAQAIETAATLDELLLLSLYELTNHFHVGWGIVGLLDDQRQLQIAGIYPPQVTPIPAVPIDDLPYARAVIAQRETVFLEYDQDGGVSPYRSVLRANNARSMLIVPLIAQDVAMGVLGLCAVDEPRPFSHSERSMARVLASQIATAIASLRLQEAAQRRSEELATLNEIASAITSTLDTREVYRLVVQQLSNYFHVEAGSILLINELHGDLEFVMTIEGGEEKLAGVRVPAGEGIVGSVVATGQWTIVDDVATDPRFYAKVSEDVGFPTQSILCVPMIAKGRVIGAIELLNKRDGHFDAIDAERLNRMAAFIGVAIENARLFQQVADGRDRLAAILDATADGILLVDMHGLVLSANPMALQLIEYPQPLVGQPVELLLAHLRARAQEVNERPWGNGNEADEDAPIFVSELRFAYGPQRHSRLLRVPVHDDQGRAYGQLIILRDISQERELEQLREDYTNMLVHDLRAPLTSIMNGVLMVQRQLVGPLNDQQLELLRIAHMGSTTMLTLINNLLDISKMEQGSMPLELKYLTPTSLVDRAIERIQVSAQSTNIRIERSYRADLPQIHADDEKMVRVLQNLLDNAIKFSPHAAVISIGIAAVDSESQFAPEIPLTQPIPTGSWVLFWVRDRGRGIPKHYHRRIFEKFGQVQGQKVRGTGLGLAFSKLAVEAHKGHIWVESEEGQGSVFAFLIPYQE
ncbi:MAG: hypothetical protein OHK0050_10650 [Roseiflexaceae bacterium]